MKKQEVSISRVKGQRAMGRMVRDTCRRLKIGCLAALKGGYNHQELGHNVLAFLRGLSEASRSLHGKGLALKA